MSRSCYHTPMTIRPVLKQPSVIPMAIALGSALLPGCDRKLGGDVPMTPELQKKWQTEEQKQEQTIPNQEIPSQAVPGALVITRVPAITTIPLGELPGIPGEDEPAEAPDLLDEESFLAPDTSTP